MEDNSAAHPVILFDGVCHLCQASVKFIVQRDPAGIFRLASLQSEVGIGIIKSFGLEPKAEPDSVVLIENGRVWQKSSAALRIARRLSGGWPLFYGLIVIPRVIRDPVYDWIARNRYRWFGRDDSCMLPGPDLRKRFL